MMESVSYYYSTLSSTNKVLGSIALLSILFVWVSVLLGVFSSSNTQLLVEQQELFMCSCTSSPQLPMTHKIHALEVNVTILLI
jgi:hypothetical protein